MRKKITYTESLDIKSLELNQLHQLSIALSDSSLGTPWNLPAIVIRGRLEGPTLGITAALHGNELNGISTIFKLVEEIKPGRLQGNLVLIPITNIPGYMMGERHFSDNVDLNRVMPGKKRGSASEIYAFDLIAKVIKKFDYLLDLHTASQGRVNTLYIRADLENEQTRTLAYLQNPRIIVQKSDGEGTLRGWANESGIPAITIEIGNPSAFQHNLVDESLEGILNTMNFLNMTSGDVQDMVADAIVCDHSYWIYSQKGGVIDVFPSLTEKIKKDQVIAHVYDVYGNIREKITSNKAGIVIGKNVNPSGYAGTRILHLGVDRFEPDPEDIPGHPESELESIVS